jgi:hypothetical protein
MSDPEERAKIEQQAERAKEKSEEQKYKGKLGKVIIKLKNFTGSEQTAKLIVGLMIFSVVLIFLLIVASIVRPRRPREPVVIRPTPMPSPTPAAYPPTPGVIRIEEGGIEELILDIQDFDIEQKDLLPPEFDYEISL